MDQRDDGFSHDNRQATFWSYKGRNAGNTEAKEKRFCIWNLGRPVGDMVRNMQAAIPSQESRVVRWLYRQVLSRMQA